MNLSENTFSTGVLTYRGHSDVVISKKRVPMDFFQDRAGLCVHKGFRNSIAIRAETLDTPATFGVKFHEITAEHGASSLQIEAVFKDRHFFNETHICAIVAEIISIQDSDKEGLFIKSGHDNIFYTSSFVVQVYWRADDNGWFVGSWSRDNDAWSRGHRVFVPRN